MNDVHIQLVGGRFDGREIICCHEDLAGWHGHHIGEWFGSARLRFYYQSTEIYRHGDETVVMTHLATASAVGAVQDDGDADDDEDESGYDGWLAPCDRYDYGVQVNWAGGLQMN